MAQTVPFRSFSPLLSESKGVTIRVSNPCSSCSHSIVASMFLSRMSCTTQTVSQCFIVLGRVYFSAGQPATWFLQLFCCVVSDEWSATFAESQSGIFQLRQIKWRSGVEFCGECCFFIWPSALICRSASSRLEIQIAVNLGVSLTCGSDASSYERPQGQLLVKF